MLCVYIDLSLESKSWERIGFKIDGNIKREKKEGVEGGKEEKGDIRGQGEGTRKKENQVERE